MQSDQAVPNAMIVTLVKTPAKDVTLQDVVLGSLGVAGALFLLAIVLGAVVSVIRLVWLKRHPPEADHLPPVSPFATGSTVPPSTRSR